MNWDLIRVGLPNGAAVLALALVPFVAIALGPIYGEEAALPQPTGGAPALIAIIDVSPNPAIFPQPF